MGLGAMGGGTQMLFGGSGGQDIFQKTTWVLGAIFMFGSLILALQKGHGSSRYLGGNTAHMATQQMPVSAPVEEMPVAPAASAPSETAQESA